MDVATFWLTLLRRWYLVLIALILTVSATWFTVRAIGPTYTAQGTVVLFPPETTVIDSNNGNRLGNPYLLLGGLSQARDIVIRRLTSKEASADWGEAHRGSEYEATPDFTTSGPIILFTVEAPTSDGVVSGLADIMETVPGTLVDLQTDLDLPPEAQITSTVITMDRTPTTVKKSQIRGGILAGGLTLTTGVLLIGLYDGLRGRRSARQARTGRRAVATESGGGGPGEPQGGGRRRANPDSASESGNTPTVPATARSADRDMARSGR